MARMAKEVSSRNTKAQIYEAYQELSAEHEQLQGQYAALVKEKQALEKRAASPPAASRATERQEAAPKPAAPPPDRPAPQGDAQEKQIDQGKVSARAFKFFRGGKRVASSYYQLHACHPGSLHLINQ